MTFWAITQDGSKLLLGRPLSVTLKKEQGVPADLLEVKFPAVSIWDECVFLDVYAEGDKIFSGIVDEQLSIQNDTGITIEFVCRSHEALLLDNEAEPAVLSSPSWKVMVQKYAQPLGFSTREEPQTIGKGQFEIYKGESCWTVLSRYAERFLQSQLWVRHQELELQSSQPKEIELSHITESRFAYRPYRHISKVRTQNAAGAYELAYPNPTGNSLPRERYFTYQDIRSPIAYLKEQEKRVKTWQVVCDGFVDASPGDKVIGDAQKSLLVTQIRYHLDEKGENTLLYLQED